MSTSKIKILFDGNCIVCDTEIMHYKRIAPEVFEMIDISANDFKASLYGLDSKDVNEKMHLFTTDGKLLIGVDAFSHIWQQIPHYRLAAKLVNLPLINQCAWVGYRVFARYRHLLPKKS